MNNILLTSGQFLIAQNLRGGGSCHRACPPTTPMLTIVDSILKVC